MIQLSTTESFKNAVLSM